MVAVGRLGRTLKIQKEKTYDSSGILSGCKNMTSRFCYFRHLLLALAIAFLAGCAAVPRFSRTPSTKKPPDKSVPRPSSASSVQGKHHQTGMASYYAAKFHGRTTASGEPFNMHHLTAAHPKLPFNSLVRVTNVRNNKSVVVRINDRGPYTRGRIIDLSLAAAKKIDLVASGTAKVTVELVKQR